MAKYIKIYNNNPTENETDGTLVSENGELFNPLTATIDVESNAPQYIKFALRCSEGYETKGNVIIKFLGERPEKWKIAKDNGLYTELIASQALYTDELTLSDKITDKNMCFWLKVTADDDEEAQSDISTCLQIKAKIVKK